MERLNVAVASPAENPAFRTFYLGMNLTFNQIAGRRVVSTDYQKEDVNPFGWCEMASADALASLEKGEIDIAVVDQEQLLQAKVEQSPGGGNGLRVRAVLDFTTARDQSPVQLAVVTREISDATQNKQANLITTLIDRKYRSFATKNGFGTAGQDARRHDFF